jgi:opacity protein-like surface antigen
VKKAFAHVLIFLLYTSHGFSQHPLTPNGHGLTYRLGIGLAGEYSSINVDVKNRPAAADPLDGDFSSHAHQSCRKFQLSPGIELGAFLHDTYYFGFTLTKSFVNAQSSINVPMTTFFHFEHSFKLKNYINAFLKCGYKPTQHIMFFGLIGPSYATWSDNTKDVYAYQDSHNTTRIVGDTTDVSLKSRGIGLGGGVEYWATKDVTVSLQYGIHLHKAKNIHYNYSYAQLGFGDDGLPNYQTRNGSGQKKVRLSYSTITLRLSYFFSF